MSQKNKIRIKKGEKYKIITNSPTFKEKYGTTDLYILIEDRDYVVFGDEWHKKTYVPAVVAFMFRQSLDKLNDSNVCYYGKVFGDSNSFGLGELVFDYELKQVE